MPSLAITSIGVDRPGIVAAVTAVLLARGCNLEDTAMSVLRGQFAMVMVVAAPEGSTATEVETAIADGTEHFDLVTVVRELHDVETAAAAGSLRAGSDRAWTVVVYGPDHPGIVHLVAERLAALDVNIVDVTTRVTGSGAALYSMVMEVVPPAGLSPQEAQESLAAAAEGEGLTVRVTPADSDLL